MKRRSWPIWLLRDLPAFLGVMLSFWPLVILLISSERRVMRGKTLRRSVFETIALLLAHPEARLTFALTRQAYRRLGWNPRLVRFNLIPATYNLREVQERYANYVNAFGDMNSVVEAYIDDIRQRYRIAERDLVAHGSTDARQSRAAHHELYLRTPLQALILSSTRDVRPSKDERGYAHARGPPLHPNFRKSNPITSQAHPRDRTAMPAHKTCGPTIHRALSPRTDQAALMSLSSFGKLIAIAAVLAIGPVALAQTPTDAPEDGAAFQCSDGSKMVLSFTQPSAASEAATDDENSQGISALVWVHGANYRLDYLPPEPGPVQVVWSDGEHELTWSPGVHLMWMASDTHLMCGRGEHKH